MVGGNVLRRCNRLGMLLPFALALWLAACGVSSSTSLGGATGTPTHAASETVTTATMTPRPAVTSTESPVSDVTLSTDNTTYSPSSTITVVLVNHRSSRIVTYDHQTSCTILTLQRQTATGWQNVGGCALGIATRQVTIDAGQTMKIALSPGGGQIRATPWPTGTYRAVLSFSPLTAPGVASTPNETAMTGTFSVQ